MFLSPTRRERLGEGASKAVRNSLTQPLPLAGERRMTGREARRAQFLPLKTNFAPARMPVGQRAVTALALV